MVFASSLTSPSISSDGRGASPIRPPFSPFNLKPDSELRSPVDKEMDPVFHAERVAVITGAASGIGRAACLELATQGLRIVLVDVNEKLLAETAKEVAAIVGESNILVAPTDVSNLEDVQRLKERVLEMWGEVSVLMNNAAIGPVGKSWDGLDNWHKIFSINVMGVVNVQQTFVPAMIYQENPSVIINTGSKQGITNPPGNAAYNASKAAVKSLTESLAHELRNTPGAKLTAHLFIPGWTYTSLGTSPASSAPTPPPETKPAGAWTAHETVVYMLDKVRAGAFYILCPDGEVRREVDALRVLWAAGDVAEGRPALSRWDPDWKNVFEEWVREGLAGM